jgi:hypothetical protein
VFEALGARHSRSFRPPIAPEMSTGSPFVSTAKPSQARIYPEDMFGQTPIAYHAPTLSRDAMRFGGEIPICAAMVVAGNAALHPRPKGVDRPEAA